MYVLFVSLFIGLSLGGAFLSYCCDLKQFHWKEYVVAKVFILAIFTNIAVFSCALDDTLRCEARNLSTLRFFDCYKEIG